jgi:5-methylcytosine-specific restriction protein A
MAWHRTSRQARGYGREWELLRRQALERDDYLCVYCLAATPERTTSATEVDHRESKAACKASGRDPDVLENLASTCTDCHREKSLRERGHQAHPKTAFDRRGRPLDPDHPWNRR